MDTMRHMQHLGGTVEHLMNLYRIEHPELNRTTPPHIRYREALRKIKDSIYNGSTFGASAAKATAQEALRD